MNILLNSLIVLLSIAQIDGFGLTTTTISKRAPITTRHVDNVRTTVRLNLFGGKKEGGGDKKGPGMMDQLAMLKKAQEVASKKMTLDKELAKTEHVGKSSNEKVTVTVKYIPPLPLQQPGYDGVAMDIDDDFLSSGSSEDISEAISEAIKDGYVKATLATAQKMQELTMELSAIMGNVAGGAAPPS